MNSLYITETLFEYLVNIISEVLPGIRRVFSVSQEDGELIFRLKDQNHPLKEFQPSERPYWYRMVEKYRKEGNNHFNWYSQVDIPIDEDLSEKGRRDLFSESENIVLLINLQNHEDQLSDLIFIFFRKNLSTFGLSHVDHPFNPDHKALAGYIIANFIHKIRDEYTRNLQAFKGINENVRMIIHQNESNLKKLGTIKDSYGESLLSLCNEHLMELSAKYKKNFILTRDAIDKIRNFSGNISLLKLILEDAVSFVSQIYFDEDDIDIHIHGWEMNFNKFLVQDSISREIRRIDNKESKAMQLLDKLEKSAEEVLRSNLPLTSANVGQYCPTPISAPAISDALKKNKKRVVNLLKKYPEKWRIIRNQFRPLINIQQKKDDIPSVSVS